ncbi:hypothetical protein PG984_002412 [Apiospora sp. TS-2023a]
METPTPCPLASTTPCRRPSAWQTATTTPATDSVSSAVAVVGWNIIRREEETTKSPDGTFTATGADWKQTQAEPPASPTKTGGSPRTLPTLPGNYDFPSPSSSVGGGSSQEGPDQSSSSSSSSSSSTSSQDDTNGTATTIGISAGVSVAVVLLILGAVLLVVRRRRRGTGATQQLLQCSRRRTRRVLGHRPIFFTRPKWGNRNSSSSSSSIRGGGQRRRCRHPWRLRRPKRGHVSSRIDLISGPSRSWTGTGSDELSCISIVWLDQIRLSIL